MTITRRKGSRFFRYDFRVGGKRYQGSTHRTTKAEADRFEAKLRTDILNGVQFGVLPEITLRAAADAWYLSEGQTMGDAKGSASRIRKLFGETLTPTGLAKNRYGIDPEMKLSALTGALLIRLKGERIKEGNTLGTINRELSLVQSIIRHSKAAGYKVPDIEIKDAKSKERRAKLRFYTLAEESRLLAELDPARESKGLAKLENRNSMMCMAMQDQYDRAIFMLDTGARYDEMASVTWDTVSLPERTVNLYREKVGNEGQLALTERLHAVLTRRRAATENSGSPFIFPARATPRCPGGREGPVGYTGRGIKAAIERAELNAPHLVARFGRATPNHTFRHTFASRLIQAGVSLYKVSKLLGHADIHTTEIYAHLVPSETAQEAASVLDQLHARAAGDNVVKLTGARVAGNRGAA